MRAWIILMIVGLLSMGTALAQTDPGANDRALVAGKTFQMGSPDGVGRGHEHPQHEISLDPFAIDKHEISNARYAAFVVATKHGAPTTCSTPWPAWNQWQLL